MLKAVNDDASTRDGSLTEEIVRRGDRRMMAAALEAEIEPTFAVVRLRTKVTKGDGSRAAGLAMVFKLIGSAQARRRAVNGAHFVPRVRAGAHVERGPLVERPEAVTA